MSGNSSVHWQWTISIISHMERGQYIRLFITKNNSDAVVALATELSLHVSASAEDATTKDNGGSDPWQYNEIVGLSYDITTTALIPATTDSANSLDEFITNVGNQVSWKICQVSGDDNRTQGALICSGTAIITNLQENAPNRQKASFTATLNGVGALTVGPLVVTE